VCALKETGKTEKPFTNIFRRQIAKAERRSLVAAVMCGAGNVKP
jgi:hypothetical protein